MTWDLGQLAIFAGTAGLLSALLTQAFSWLGGWWSSRRRARHMALRLAVHFETYGYECGSTISTLERHSHGSEEGDICYAPKFPELPGSSEAWEHLDAALAHRVLAFPYLVFSNNESISGEYDLTDTADTRGNMLKALDLGLKAFIIGKDLRYAYGLPQFVELEFTVDWMSREAVRLRAKIKSISDKRKEQAAQREADRKAKLPVST